MYEALFYSTLAHVKLKYVALKTQNTVLMQHREAARW